jgi:sugar phosphate isomerase/epimerase
MGAKSAELWNMTATARPGICLAGLVPDALTPHKESVRAAVDAAADAGFDGSSIWVTLLPFVADSLKDARALLDGRGLHVRMVEGAFSWATDASDDDVRAEGATVIETAEAMGSSLILAVCLGPDLPDAARAQARLADLAARAKTVGATVCVEFLPWSGIPRLRDAWDLVGPLDDVGLIIDTWHWQRQPGGPDAAALKEVPAERVSCLQLSDAPREASGELMEETMTARLLPGDGEVDFTPITDWLSGAHPFVAPEVFNPGLVTARGVGPAASATYAATVRVMGG